MADRPLPSAPVRPFDATNGRLFRTTDVLVPGGSSKAYEKYSISGCVLACDLSKWERERKSAHDELCFAVVDRLGIVESGDRTWLSHHQLTCEKCRPQLGSRWEWSLLEMLTAAARLYPVHGFPCSEQPRMKLRLTLLAGMCLPTSRQIPT
jgi:hypothetical protein